MRLGVALKIRQRPDVLQGNHVIELNVLTMLTPKPKLRNQDFYKKSAMSSALGQTGFEARANTGKGSSGQPHEGQSMGFRKDWDSEKTCQRTGVGASFIQACWKEEYVHFSSKK
jgi:hypothetical protein